MSSSDRGDNRGSEGKELVWNSQDRYPVPDHRGEPISTPGPEALRQAASITFTQRPAHCGSGTRPHEARPLHR